MIDPKKALATQDAQGEQDEVEARSQLVAMVTSGLAPDDVATSLMRTHWAGELGRVAVGLAILYGADWLHLRRSETYFTLFLLFIFPVWTVRAAWMPLRGRRPVAWIRDLLYQVQASAQGILLAFLASWTGVGLIELMVGRLHRIPEGARVIMVASVAGIGVTTLAWATGRALVDREVEALPRRAIPPEGELQVAREQLTSLPLMASIARSWFRAGLVLAFFLVPVFAFDIRSLLGLSRDAVQMWSIFGCLLSASILGRQVLTTVMARGASDALLERTRRVPAPGGEDDDDDEGALVPESPGALAWQAMRHPAEQLMPALVAGTVGWMVVEAGMSFGSGGGAVAAAGIGALTAVRGGARVPGRAPAQALVGAGLGTLVFGGLSLLAPMLFEVARDLGRPLRTLALPAALLALATATERLLALWGRAVAWVGGGEGAAGREPILATILRGLTSGVLPGSLMLIGGIALVHFGQWRAGDRMIGAAMFATIVMAVQVVAQLRLAEATAAPEALPEGAGGGPPAEDPAELTA